MKPYLIRGGIGDFIQCLDSVIALHSEPDARFIVYSTFKGAKDFFEPFVDLTRFEFHISEQVHLKVMLPQEEIDKMQYCPRSIYQQFQLPYQPLNPFDNQKEIIGIHAFGSPYAKHFHKLANLPEKTISLSCVEKLIRPQYNYLFFGSEAETQRCTQLLRHDNVKFISYNNIWQSLSHVSLCRQVIAVDSALKTLSLAKKIPTLLVVADYEDPMRDELFINPYVGSRYLYLCKLPNPPENNQAIIACVNHYIYGESNTRWWEWMSHPLYRYCRQMLLKIARVPSKMMNMPYVK